MYVHMCVFTQRCIYTQRRRGPDFETALRNRSWFAEALRAAGLRSWADEGNTFPLPLMNQTLMFLFSDGSGRLLRFGGILTEEHSPDILASALWQVRQDSGKCSVLMIHWHFVGHLSNTFYF